MDYADQALEKLLNQYHQTDDLQVFADIEKTIKSKSPSIDDLAMINNAFYYFMQTQRRPNLRNWALEMLKEIAIITETYNLLKLYVLIDGQGVLAYFINHHLRERLVSSELWHNVIMTVEHISFPLTSFGSQFILQHSNDPYFLADIHSLSSIGSKLRRRLTEKIIALNGLLSYEDWEEIADRCAFPSRLHSYAINEMDEAYYVDEKDLPRTQHIRKKRKAKNNENKGKE